MTLKSECDQFNNASKLILKTKLSTNLNTLSSYREKIILTNNSVVQYINSIYEKAQANDKKTCDDTLIKLREKFERCINRLNCKHNLPSLNSLITDTHVGPVALPSTNDPDSQDETEFNREEDDLDLIPDLAMDTTSYLRLCAATINKNYAGDPLSLQSFTDSIDMLHAVAETNPLKTLLFTFAKTKLEGRAREFITATVTNIDELKAALMQNIKPDNSHIVEGRMLSLKFQMNQSDQFALKVEELSDALRRTLIIEGVSSVKANEIAIEKTIELCRKNTQSPLIKSVLEATKFEQPKDVVSKLITQIDKTKSEVQILTVNHQNNFNPRRGRGNFRGSYNQNQRGRGNHFNSAQQTQYFGNQFRGRGRGRGRGNYNGQQRQYFNNYNNRPFNQSQGHPSHIRTFMNQGNGQAAPVQGQIMGRPYDNTYQYQTTPTITTPSEI